MDRTRIAKSVDVLFLGQSNIIVKAYFEACRGGYFLYILLFSFSFWLCALWVQGLMHIVQTDMMNQICAAGWSHRVCNSSHTNYSFVEHEDYHNDHLSISVTNIHNRCWSATHTLFSSHKYRTLMLEITHTEKPQITKSLYIYIIWVT